MNKKNKNFYSIAVIFCIITFMLLVIFVGILTSNTVDSGFSFNEPYSMGSSWMIVDEEEDIKWDNLPYYNEYRQEEFQLYNYLPEDLGENTCIFFRTNYQSIKVEIEGYGVIYDEREQKSEIVGQEINVLTHLVELKPEYSGKKIIVTSEECAIYQYPTLEEVLLAEKGDLMFHVLGKTVIGVYFICLTAVLGLLLIILAVLMIVNKSTKYIADCLCLAVFTLLFDTWLTCNISEIQCIIQNRASLYLIYTFTLYVVLLPIFVLLRNKAPRFSKLYDGLFIFDVCLMTTNFAVAHFTSWKLLESSITLHVFLMIAIIMIIITLFIDYIKYENKAILSFIVSGLIFFTCIGMSMVAYYFPNFKNNIIDYDFFVKVAFIVFILINGVTYLQQVILASLKMSESAIYRKLAFTDLMTNLNNRSSFDHYLNTLTEEMFDSISIIEVDIDGLKFINDNYGHSVGDEMIKKVALEIKEIFGDYSKCFRIGGDEFEIIIVNENESFINLLIERFKTNIDNMILSCGSKVYVSIGVTFDDGTLSKYGTIANLINATDHLMYENKHINKMNNVLE